MKHRVIEGSTLQRDYTDSSGVKRRIIWLGTSCVMDIHEGSNGTFGNGWTRMTLKCSNFWMAGAICIWPRIKNMSRKELEEFGFKYSSISVTVTFHCSS